MFARVFQAQFKPETFDTYNSKLKPEIINTLQKQPGFVDAISLTHENNPQKVVVVTFWKTRSDLTNYERNTAPRIREQLTPYLTTTTPTIENCTVDTTVGKKLVASAA